MNFEKLLTYKPKRPFKIIKKDLSIEPNMKAKTFFTEEDMRIDHSNERLNRGEIEIPVFEDKTIRPLGFKGKLLSVEVERLGGGFYIITHKQGKVRPKPNDHRFPIQEVKKDDLHTFFIGYDNKAHTYKYFEKEKNFLELYKEIEEIKNSEDIQQLINSYIDWIRCFWSEEFKKEYHLTSFAVGKQSYNDFLSLFSYIKEHILIMKNYHGLLNVFEDICDKTYEYILNSIKTLESLVVKGQQHIFTHFPDTSVKVNHRADELLGKPLIDVTEYIEERIMTPGYFVELNTKQIYPNLYEVFSKEQFAVEFESDKSIAEKKTKLLQEALNKKATFFKINK
ncbi:hypothetical protein ACOJQI_22820 (plasmid) [Bacillus salacetis]|uniref:hypothetical protein n=1 Tax=Bacillus salacetis TaxID=2315464 RepID=UPI003B9EC3B1